MKRPSLDELADKMEQVDILDRLNNARLDRLKTYRVRNAQDDVQRLRSILATAATPESRHNIVNSINELQRDLMAQQAPERKPPTFHRARLARVRQLEKQVRALRGDGKGLGEELMKEVQAWQPRAAAASSSSSAAPPPRRRCPAASRRPRGRGRPGRGPRASRRSAPRATSRPCAPSRPRSCCTRTGRR